MTTRSVLNLLRKTFPELHSIRTGQGSMRNTVIVFGGTWENRQDVAAAAAPYFTSMNIRVVL